MMRVSIVPRVCLSTSRALIAPRILTPVISRSFYNVSRTPLTRTLGGFCVRMTPRVPLLHLRSFSSPPSNQKNTNTPISPIPSQPSPSTHNTPSAPAPEEHEEEKSSLSPIQKIRKFARKYGPVGFITYFGIYYTTVAAVYLIIEVGGFSGTIIESLNSWGIDKYVDLSKMNPKLGSLGLAWVLTKFTEPVRLAITVAITPRMVRIWDSKRPALLAWLRSNRPSEK
eukprot:TRINITY_DN5617_c0_g1_i3.p1 TRINITY_DN5617_c0_g1~~TRINITY_DN5617_c0_g1_i3.p1  ORF type:complete len:226 (-),score=27.57 TRINITY_DN5617_c0_g1_i3:81-758(-)